MDSIINEKGLLFYRRRKKELYQYLYVAPVFIFIISFVFVLGAKNNLHLYFSFFLILLLISIFTIALLSFAKRLNKTISKISVDADDNIEFGSFKVLFLESIVTTMKISELKLYPKKFQINKREIIEGWVIKLNNNKKLYLHKDFFNPEIINRITKY